MPNKSEIALLAKAILEVNMKAAVVWSYDSGDRVGAEMCLEPETEKALRALARETTDD